MSDLESPVRMRAQISLLQWEKVAPQVTDEVLNGQSRRLSLQMINEIIGTP